MPLISVGVAPPGYRWFHLLVDTGEDGPWHLGRVWPGSTWPAGRAACGITPPEGNSHATASYVMARRFCPICLGAYRDYERERSI